MTEDIADAQSGTQTINKEIELGLDPKFIGAEERAVNRMLHNMRYKYSYELNGILIDYSHLKFVSDFGRIIDDNPYIFWKVSAQFNVLNICDDQLVRVKISRIGPSYCGALVGNCIDATIKIGEDVAKEEIEPYMKIDQEIIFRVKSFDMSTFFIDGVVDRTSLDRTKEYIPVTDEFNETFTQNSIFK